MGQQLQSWRSGNGQNLWLSRLIDAMEVVSVHSANGDERSFNERNHEGVVDDDIFFAVIRNMVWVPVKDDALSATLPPIPQTV